MGSRALCGRLFVRAFIGTFIRMFVQAFVRAFVENYPVYWCGGPSKSDSAPVRGGLAYEPAGLQQSQRRDVAQRVGRR